MNDLRKFVYAIGDLLDGLPLFGTLGLDLKLWVVGGGGGEA